ncbi:MAG TPA: NADH-quinone oxidoreductase subunit L [Cyclobacteriaceae bacterium]|nr:NADH-quinone oxidoreductase subunit L [Cyclobacteriaceae bacterium]
MHSFEPQTLIIITTLVALCAPLLSALIAGLISPRYEWVLYLTSSALLTLSTLASLSLLYLAWNEKSLTIDLSWFEIGDYTVTAGILIDRLTILMVAVVTIISFLVHVYSTGYMAGDAAIRQYFSMLGFFTFSMLGLVVADNLLLIFVFWELVGFSSYLLIGHWMELPEAGSAAKKAFIMNRVGDLGFIVGMMIIYSQTGTFQLNLWATGIVPWQSAASLCFFIGIMGKSAQFPLLTWLPDAMAGPTPVSALIHAATMVAAGVFLLARIYFLFTLETLTVVAIVGTITSLLGAGAALVQYDIKKILAYSTVSQLGFMMVAMGIGAKDSAILHLFTHAFFKAGLFLAAGSVIHALHQAQQRTSVHFDVQDIRHLGGLRRDLPITFIIFIVCGASLAGIPFFSGFQSKDSIISAMILWAGISFSWKWFLVAAIFLITFLTVCYTFRLIWFVFVYPSKELEKQNLEIRETPVVMRIPMMILAVGSLWWIVSLSPFSFSGWWVDGLSSHIVTLISGCWVISALLFSYLMYRKSIPSTGEKIFTKTIRNVLYLDHLNDLIAIKPVAGLSLAANAIDQRLIDGLIHMTAYAQVAVAHFISWFDRNIIDGTINGIAYFSRGLGRLARSTQSGTIQFYIFWAGLGLIGLMLYLIF